MAKLKGKEIYRRGEIWAADLRPGLGLEVAKKRPSIVISDNRVNNLSPTVIIVPISSQIPKVIGPERIIVSGKTAGLSKRSVALINQVRAIDKTRLAKKISRISKSKILEIEESLKLVLGISLK